MKTILVTGGTSGIGKATVKKLAAEGNKVVFIARNPAKAETVRNEIIKTTNNSNVSFILADLSSKKQVNQAAENFRQNHRILDVLINNAGVCRPQRRITADGMEETFQINHLSHFMLSNLLLDLFNESHDARIINVSSGGHSGGKFDINNLQSEKKFSPFGTYFNTKLLNILFTLELAERLKEDNITVNALHPGVVATRFARNLGGVFRLYPLAKPFLLSPERGAETSVYLATSDEVKNITGKYFIKCKPALTDNADITPENQKILWDISLSLSR